MFLLTFPQLHALAYIQVYYNQPFVKGRDLSDIVWYGLAQEKSLNLSPPYPTNIMLYPIACA